ncbi:MAG: DUF1330 domain-containing protein [Pseudomonadota bacterium]
MPKGYWIAHVEVDDPDTYVNYVNGAKAAFEKYGARFLARGGKYAEVEGALGRSRHVVIEFDSYDDALNCYHSDAYQAAKAHREPVSVATITLIEGLE